MIQSHIIYIIITCSFNVREYIRLLFANMFVKINRAISSIITFKRVELKYNLKNLNEHELISNNLKNKRTIRKQNHRLQP